MRGITKLKLCDYCKQGIGKYTYESKTIVGKYCTSNCYMDAMIDEYGFGLKGKFDLKTDGHLGVEIIPILPLDKH